MKTCVICAREYPDANCVTFVLTAEEEAALVKQGVLPLDEFAYCAQCWKIIQDPVAGPRLMRGTVERHLLGLGVEAARAKRIADRYHTRLVELQRTSHQKTQA